MIFIPFFVGKKAISLGEDMGLRLAEKILAPASGRPSAKTGNFKEGALRRYSRTCLEEGGNDGDCQKIS